MDLEGVTITINDVRRMGNCVKGSRRWFEANGFNFRDFLKNGLPAQVLWDTGDALAIRVIEQKMKDLADG